MLAGTISTTGTGPRVGKAISSTTILVAKQSRKAKGTGGIGTVTAATIIECGFTPSLIRIYGNHGGTAFMSSVTCVWQRGLGINGSSVLYNEATAGQGDQNARLYETSTSNYTTFSISALTERGFTLDTTETGTVTGGAYLWEAEE